MLTKKRTFRWQGFVVMGATLVLASCGREEQVVNPPKFVVGSKTSIRMEELSEQTVQDLNSTSEAKKNLPQNTRTVIDVDEEVVAVNPNEVVLKYTFRSIEMALKVLLADNREVFLTLYNSKHPTRPYDLENLDENQRAAFENYNSIIASRKAFFDKLIDRSFEVSMSLPCTVVKASGMEAIFKEVDGSKVPPEYFKEWSEGYSDNAMADAFVSSRYVLYPTTQANLSSRWSTSMTSPVTDVGTLKNDYTVLVKEPSPTPRWMQVHYTAVCNLTSSGKGSFVEKSSVARTGYANYDRERGCFTLQEDTTVWDVTLRGEDEKGPYHRKAHLKNVIKYTTS